MKDFYYYFVDDKVIYIRGRPGIPTIGNYVGALVRIYLTILLAKGIHLKDIENHKIILNLRNRVSSLISKPSRIFSYEMRHITYWIKFKIPPWPFGFKTIKIFLPSNYI